MVSREAVLSSQSPLRSARRHERRLVSNAPSRSSASRAKHRGRQSSSHYQPLLRLSHASYLHWGLGTGPQSDCLPVSLCIPSCCRTEPGLVCGSMMTQSLHPGASVKLRSPCEIVSWEDLSPEHQACHQTPSPPQLPPTLSISHFYLT